VLGNLDVEPVRPARRDSLFRITSTTKPITAAATLALVGEGLISLEEPVDRLLPELAGRRVLRRPDGPLEDMVPAARAITIRDLLTFTFGFGMVLDMFAAPEPWPVVAAEQQLGLATFGPPDPSLPPDPDTWISRLGSLPLLAQPGERWMYNTGAAVLGVLLAGGRCPSGEPVLSPELARAMISDQLTPAQKDRGGLGQGFFDGRSWGFCQAVYDSGAYGWDGGFGTSWLVDPARELVVIVLTQRMFESPATPQVHRDIQATAYAAT
jgi:CubicO group peptidase (beta-lactamase class C family)